MAGVRLCFIRAFVATMLMASCVPSLACAGGTGGGGVAASPVQAGRDRTVTLPGVPSPPGETPHSGDIIRARDGKYYWYGDSYRGFVWSQPSRYGGVIVYRSSDLRHWNGPYRAFDPFDRYWQSTCMKSPSQPDYGCFRAKVLYDSTTRLYVMWIDTPHRYRVLTSPSPLGPFKRAATPDLQDTGIPGSRGQTCTNGGDESLWADRTGRYLVFNRCGRLLVERLTSTMLRGAGRPVQIDDYPEIGPFYGAEAPSLFRGPSGHYWIAFSLPQCPYCKASTGLEEAPTALGPWHYAGVLSQTSGGGQPNQVSVVGDDLWLYSSDTWLRPPGYPDVSEVGAGQRWARLRFSAGKIKTPIFSSHFTVRLPRGSDTG